MTIEQILEAIEIMKVLELNELVKAAEEKFGVSASAPVMLLVQLLVVLLKKKLNST